MAKKSEFDYMEGQEHKQIDKVAWRGGSALIAWSVITEDGEGEKEVDKGSINCHETPADEFHDCMRDLAEFVRQYMTTGASGNLKKRWERASVKMVKFRHNQKGVTAAITAEYPGGDGQVAVIELPATPLLDNEVEGHASGAVTTYGEHLTKRLEELQRQAKMYLGGARGAEEAA